MSNYGTVSTLKINLWSNLMVRKRSQHTVASWRSVKDISEEENMRISNKVNFSVKLKHDI